MKRILITGADGNLGGKLVKRIVDYSDYGVIAVSSFPERIPRAINRESIINQDKVIQMSSERMFEANLESMGIFGAVHFAFSRAIFPNKDIANSLDYSLAAFTKMVCSKIPNGIYISSQSIYGDSKEIRTVNTTPAPNSIYAMAKYAGEKLFESVYFGADCLQHAIIRLDNVIQSQNLVKTLCRNAKAGQNLNLTGGKQVFSYIDESEVSDAIYALLTTENQWKAVYNVGPNNMRVTLIEIAEIVKKVAKEHGNHIAIELKQDNTELWAGMDTEDFYNDTGWRPQMNLEMMIEQIYESI